MNQTNRAAADIMEILCGLPSPGQVAKMMNDDDKAALEIWTTISAIGAAH